VKFSIITVVRNRADTIGAAIESVVRQQYDQIEHLIIDGASTDGTLDVVERYRARLATVISERDRGIYDAMNKGLALATGDVVGFLNADDEYADDRVLSDVAARFRDPSVEAVFGDLVYVSAADPGRVVRYWRSGAFRSDLFKTGWMPAHPTFFVRRAVYEKYGGFDLSFRLQADFELTLRLLEIHRIRSVYLPRVLVRMRTGGATNRNIANVIKGNLEAYRACRQNGVAVSPLFVVRKVVRRLPQFFLRPGSIDVR
jgi:glycosyltransferase involved in cell wall biosynthesis